MGTKPGHGTDESGRILAILAPDAEDSSPSLGDGDRYFVRRDRAGRYGAGISSNILTFCGEILPMETISNPLRFSSCIAILLQKMDFSSVNSSFNSAVDNSVNQASPTPTTPSARARLRSIMEVTIPVKKCNEAIGCHSPISPYSYQYCAISFSARRRSSRNTSHSARRSIGCKVEHSAEFRVS